jgi:PAS domain S-box-containing protein
VTMQLRVLFLEDQPDDVRLLEHELRRAGYDPVGARVETEAEFCRSLDSPPDLILSDYTLPGFNGLDGLRIVRQRGLDVPFIFVSGTMGEDVAVDAMRHGADDYLLKDRLTRLGPAVEHALGRRRLLLQKQRAEEVTARLAAIVESSADAIIATTVEGTITSWNAGAERLYGYSAAEVVGKPIGILIPPRRRQCDIPEDHADMARRTGHGDRIDAYETVRVRKDGRRVDVLVSISPIRDTRGTVLGASVIAHDISARKRAERLLAAEHAVTGILAECHTLAEASPRLLRTLAEALRWEVAVLWQVDPQANVLRRVDTWHASGAAADFLERPGQATTLECGEGIAGRAWSSAAPVWEPRATPSGGGSEPHTEAPAGLHGPSACRCGCATRWSAYSSFATRRSASPTTPCWQRSTISPPR